MKGSKERYLLGQNTNFIKSWKERYLLGGKSKERYLLGGKS